MERIQWEETPRLGVSEGIRLRIGPNPFLGRHEKGYGKDTTARFEVSGGIRTFKIELAQVLSSDDLKGLWKAYQDKKPLSRGSPDA